MAYPSSQISTEKNPQTRCSNCQTVFEVSRELLASSDTRVRCGECLSIFDALEGLRSGSDRQEELAVSSTGTSALGRSTPTKPATSPASKLPGPSAASLAGLANDTSALDVTYSDFDLFSEEADLPEIAYFDQTRDTPEFDFDSVEMGDDETFNDTLFVHDITIDAESSKQHITGDENGVEAGTFADVDFIGEQEAKEPLIFNYRDKASEVDSPVNEVVHEAKVSPQLTPEHDVLLHSDTIMDDSFIEDKKPANSWWFRGSMFFLLVALLGGLYVYRSKEALLKNPSVRSTMISICGYLPCNVDPLVDVSAITALKQNVSSHPNLPNALKVIIKFRNDAEFDQAYPVIVMRLFDNLGRVVAKRDFFPEEYIANWQADITIKSAEIVVVTLDINDPGTNAGSFDFKFREP